MDLPPELLDIIMSFVCQEYDHGVHNWLNVFSMSFAKRSAQTSLAALRLVNRAFCAAASRHFFKTFDASIGSADQTRSMAKLLQLIDRHGHYASCVRYVLIGFGPNYNYRSCLTFNNYKTDLGLWLTEYLHKLPRLTHLEICAAGARALRDSRPTMAQDMLSSIGARLCHQDAPRLDSLHITLRNGHDLKALLDGQAFRHLDTSILPHLQRLEVEIRRTEPRVRLDDDFAKTVSDMMQQAKNVRELSFSLDYADITPLSIPGPMRLQCLRLSNVKISSRRLLELICHSRDSLKILDVGGGSLTSGAWKQVILNLATLLPNLLEFTGQPVVNCWETGPIRPGRKKSQKTYEKEARDLECAFSVLEHTILERRKGLGLGVDSYHYRRATAIPLEEALQHLGSGEN